MIDRVIGVVTAPVRIAGQVASGLVEWVAGPREERWMVHPQASAAEGPSTVPADDLSLRYTGD